MSKPGVVVLCSLLLGSVGCDELDLQGRLGNGEFEYDCGGPGDAACDGTETILGFDLDRDVLPIAVGGNFGFRFDDDDEAIIFPASREMVTINGSSMRFDQPGTVDFLARNSEGEVIDFVDLTAVSITGLQLFYDGDPVDGVAVDRFDDGELAVAPMNGGEVLGGGLSYSWTVSGTGVELRDVGDDNVVQLYLRDSSASGTVTVTSGSFTASAAVWASN